MNSGIEKIIEAGVLAPSGENSQPWRFVVHGDEVRIFNIPERDQSLYSWGQRSSLLAHGALLENIAIAAQTLGFSPRVSLFPDAHDNMLVAQVRLERGPARPHPLFSAISDRVTNRKEYKNIPLTTSQREEIMKAGASLVGARAVFVEDGAKRRDIARAAAINEEVLFGNEHMHRFFFEHINWTGDEDARKSTGFYIKTLELPPPAQVIFRLFRHWPVARFLGKIGFPKKIAEQNAKIYVSGAMSGAIVIPGIEKRDFITAGQLVERMWLTVTRLGLSFQPLAGITFLMLRIFAKDLDKFTPAHTEQISRAYKELENAFGVTGEVIPMVFRVGYGDKPTARASRLPPEIRFER